MILRICNLVLFVFRAFKRLRSRVRFWEHFRGSVSGSTKISVLPSPKHRLV